MARQRKKQVIDLNPIVNGNTSKIGKVGITTEKSGSSKIRFSYKGKTFSHGVGRLDNDLYRDKVYDQCKAIAIDLVMNRFNPDNWKLTYFGIDKNSKVINFPSQNTVTVSQPVKSELTLIDIWENYLKFKGTKNKVYSRIFPINATLADLINRLPRIPNEHNLVFPRYEDHGFIVSKTAYSNPSQIFKTIIEGLFNNGLISVCIPYYNERHTFTTEVIKTGKVDVSTLSSLIGNSPQTIYNHYFATDKNIVIPDIY